MEINSILAILFFVVIVLGLIIFYVSVDPQPIVHMETMTDSIYHVHALDWYSDFLNLSASFFYQNPFRFLETDQKEHIVKHGLKSMLEPGFVEHLDVMKLLVEERIREESASANGMSNVDIRRVESEVIVYLNKLPEFHKVPKYSSFILPPEKVWSLSTLMFSEMYGVSPHKVTPEQASLFKEDAYEYKFLNSNENYADFIKRRMSFGAAK